MLDQLQFHHSITQTTQINLSDHFRFELKKKNRNSTLFATLTEKQLIYNEDASKKPVCFYTTNELFIVKQAKQT